MKKSILSAIMLFIAWAVSASAVTTPLSAIMRLESAVCRYEYTGKPILEAWDYSTSYSYDRNANITSLSRQGVIDNIGIRKEFGLHSRYSMKYAVNRLSSMEIEREGEDYEGRTGVSATGKISDFWYDANGNLGRDLSRGILSTNYNRLDLPTDVYFINGHRQTIEYDGFGQKRRVSYSQTSDPILGTMMGVPEDSTYTLTGRRDYIGSHVFVGDSLEYSAFPGGYFTPDGVFYYITDWQGNNIAVFSDKGELVQQTTYYPYGEPTIEPTGQRYLFGGKEREHAGGRNSYDYGPRNLGPSANWDSPDKLATETPQISPFSYCGGDPINRVDPTGLAWHLVDSIAGDDPCFKWVDDKLSYDKDGNLKPNHYKQGILFSPTDKEVVYNSTHKDYNIGTSTATVYKADGTTENFDACTVPSDPDKYTTVPEGIYEAKVGKHHPNSPTGYTALRLSDVGTTNFYNNKIELGMPNPSNPTQTVAVGSNIHKAGIKNFTGIGKDGNAVSQCCLLIDRNRWNEFISIFDTKFQRGSIIGVILKR